MADYYNSFKHDIDIADRVLVVAYGADPGDDFIADSGTIYAIGGVHDNTYSITANWKSKRLDFADKFPQYKDWWKTIDLVQLKYKDQYANTPVTIYISKDGVTWDSVTKLLATADNAVKTTNFHFRNKEHSTGVLFYIKLESSSASTSFEWHGIYVKFEPRGPAFDI